MGTKSKPASPKAETKVLFVRIPPHLHQRIRVYVAERDLKRRDVLVEAIEEYLKKRGA